MSKDQSNPQTKTTTDKNLDKSLTEINMKLNNVLTKDDQSFLKKIIKETILEVREEILLSVTHRLEKMESEIHDMAVENETLKQEVKKLTTTATETTSKWR